MMKMFQWRVLTIGHLSRNKFWGESEAVAYRDPLATTTLIQGEGVNILVDPSLAGEQMKQVLFDQSGLPADAINMIYCTHFHGDHCMGLEVFPNAVCFMAPDDLRDAIHHKSLDETIITRLQQASGQLIPGIELMALPGHTTGLCGLLFDGPEGRILITGDAVMTAEFFQAGEGYWYSQDLAECSRTIRRIRKAADVVVPGHGNYFVVNGR